MDVQLYALSTCPYCRMTRKYLDDLGIPYQLTEVDLLEGEQRSVAVAEVKRRSGGTSFPVLVVGEETIVGFNRNRIAQVLGL